MSPNTSPFVYTALRRPGSMIRLLKIKQAYFRTDPVDCELLHFSIHHAPNYGALSYCWGNGPESRKMLCNHAFFHIRPSLENALKRLRAGFSPGQREDYIWVDAVCIDQQNETEKADQIMLMQHIYPKAQTVYVDLGDMDGVTISFGGKALTWSSGVGMGRQDTLTRTDSQDYPLHYKTAFLALTRPWFTRTWIIQEITLARRAKFMFCGNVFDQEQFDASLT